MNRFVVANLKLSAWIRPVPADAVDFYGSYANIVGHEIARYSSPIVLDIGGGAKCLFSSQARDARVIAVDISPDELAKNHDVRECRVADASKSLPFEDNSVDIITSRLVLEHLADVSRFVTESARVLKPGGVFITQFASRNTPSAIANRIIPNELTRVLLRQLTTFAAGAGFVAYYDHCSPRQFSRILEGAGFEVTNLRCCYFQADYYAFFVPLYLASCCYEWLVEKLQLSSLCSAVLVVAAKPS
jgi:ubiquinone/menaquinone biosynthesis C-methylase UbiE